MKPIHIACVGGLAFSCQRFPYGSGEKILQSYSLFH